MHSADLNVKTKFGTPLMAAAARDTAELIELFLANGADPNSESEGQTALHVATERGCLDCVKALVEAGSNVNAQHRIDSGQHILVTTPLHLAIANGHGDIADYLMAHGVILPRPAPIADKLASADLDKGRVFFEGECHACHAINPEQVVQLGPNLWNIIGRDKASLDDHEYSKTLLALQGEWTYEDTEHISLRTDRHNAWREHGSTRRTQRRLTALISLLTCARLAITLSRCPKCETVLRFSAIVARAKPRGEWRYR